MIKLERERSVVKKTGKNIKFKGIISAVMWPKNLAEHLPGDNAIVKIRIVKVLVGEDIINPNEFITIKGPMPRIEYYAAKDEDIRENTTYIVSASQIIDSIWGTQYEVNNMRMDFPLESIEDQKKFLSRVLTEKQVEALFNLTDNPMQLLENRDVEALCQIKGVSNKTANRLIAKYDASIDSANALVSLGDYGLTNHAIHKLVKIYHSPDIAIERIKENPYVLIREVRGYGWSKADQIALNQGIEKDSEKRVKAYTEYYLEEQCEKNGHSWMDINVLLTAVQTECAPITDEKLISIVKNMLTEEVEKHFYDVGVEDEEEEDNAPRIITEKGPLLYFEPETNQVGLMRYYNIENTIAQNLYRIQTSESSVHFDKDFCAKVIEQVEEEQGFEYTEEQKNAIWNIINNQVSILSGKAGCVDGETEFFSQNGWKKIKDFTWEDKVLQYNDDGTTGFVTPECYIKEPEEFFWHIEGRLVDQCVSPDHSMYYINSQGKSFRQKASEFVPRLLTNKQNYELHFPTGFLYNGTGINLSDSEIKIMLAVICDGSFQTQNSTRCRFHIKKDRKKEKLRELFTEANLIYCETTSATPGYTDFYVDVPRNEKVFSQDWYNCNQHQLQIICDNILFWDGHILKNGSRQFSTNVKANADFVQFAFAACNQRATIYLIDRRGMSHSNCKYTYKSVEYRVNIAYNNTTPFPSNNNKSTNIRLEKRENEYKYCFTVPSHLWISRRTGKIAGISNCGKSYTVNAIVKIFKAYEKEVQMCALSGRAASKLGEITHITGSTIHKLLGYNPKRGGFTYNSDNKLPCDMVILDEASMVGGELFATLLKAIPNGAKFLMVGDIAQLESIGMGNVLKDCMSSGVISSNILTKIHRQAQQSGIITESIRVSNGQAAFGSDAIIDADYRGELKDLKFVTYSDYNLSQYKVLEEFREMYEKRHIPAKDIQVIVPMRVRGNISCRCLNEEIQKIVNGKDTFGSTQVTYSDNGIKWTVTYKEGDRIIITKNDYKAVDVEGKETPIFNGNIGYIKKIYSNYMIVYLKTIDKDIVLYEKQYKSIALAYCLTIHKCQGDSFPYVIFSIDNAAYAINSREAIYTGMTRARKFCSVVVQNKAFFSAIKVSRIKLKQTWLKEKLQKLFLTSSEECDTINIEE